jgi:hypothetical protein
VLAPNWQFVSVIPFFSKNMTIDATVGNITEWTRYRVYRSKNEDLGVGATPGIAACTGLLCLHDIARTRPKQVSK